MSIESITDLRKRISENKIPHNRVRGYVDSLASRILQGNYKDETHDSIRSTANLVSKFSGIKIMPKNYMILLMYGI